jgi:hypothetical protein
MIVLTQDAGFAQTAIVKGVVIERGTGEPINGATVELAGSRGVVSNPRGEFVIPGVKPGNRRLTVKRIGYRDFQQTYDVKGDLDVRVELEVEAVRVEGVSANNRTYTIRGQVTEKKTGDPIMDAEVLLATNRSTGTNINGRFKLSKVRVGEPVYLEVRAIGMMPVNAEVDAEKDTTLHFALDADPIGQRMIAQQIARLDRRTDAVGYSVQKFPREEVMRLPGSTMFDMIRWRLAASRKGMACLFIDDREAFFGMVELQSLLPDQIERFEIIDRGLMVRVYTRRYIQDMLRKRAQPSPIVLIETPRGTTCK